MQYQVRCKAKDKSTVTTDSTRSTESITTESITNPGDHSCNKWTQCATEDKKESQNVIQDQKKIIMKCKDEIVEAPIDFNLKFPYL